MSDDEFSSAWADPPHGTLGNPEEVCAIEGQHTHLNRFVFRLPEYVGVADGEQTIHLHSISGRAPEAFASLMIHQVELPSDELTALGLDCAGAVLERLGLARPATDESRMPRGLEPHTVADVITTAASPAEPPADWDGQTQNLTALEDSFMRALHAAQTTVRAASLTGVQRSAQRPTYERAPAMLFRLGAVHKGPLDLSSPESLRAALDALDWEQPGILILHHPNLPGRKAEDAPPDELRFWEARIGSRFPGTIARERLIEAQRLAHFEGEYEKAVVAAATGIEVFADAVLSALLWEEFIGEGDQAIFDQAVETFSRDDLTAFRRAARFTQGRLGGNWTSPASPWKRHREEAAALRNRILHAGYEPRRQEALDAIQRAFDAQSFLVSQLAKNAAKYPRAATMYVGRDGLEKRDLYRGAIRRHFEEVAPTEPHPAEVFSMWHRAVIDKATTRASEAYW